MPRPHPTAPIVATVALIGGVLQVMATVMLGLAPLDELRVAAAEGARLYLLGTFASVIGLVAAWFLRKRPLWALLLVVLWHAAIFWPLSARTSKLGLAFHGEYVLHHFTGLVAAAAIVAIASGWIRNATLGAARFAPAALALTGTVGLVAAHLIEQPSMGMTPMPALEQASTAALLLAWGVAIAALWPHLGPARLRWVALALWLPFVVRVAFAWPDGLSGASVSHDGRTVLMLAMLVAAGTTFGLFRTNLPAGLRAMVLAFCGFVTLTLYYFYRHGFGDLEAGLGGLAQSMFAFSLPYPTYVSTWEVWLVMLGLFALFASAYAGLVSPGQRIRGVAIALLAVAGLGLSTPPLALMSTAAALLWVDSLVGDGEAAFAPAAPADPMDDILEATAERLAGPQVLSLGDGRQTVLALKGDLDDVSFDLRARSLRDGHWQVTLEVGVLGRGRAPLRLVPEGGDNGHRPAHLLARTHRAQGQVRQIELLDDTLFDALLPFTSAELDLWAAGTRCRLGRDLSGLTTDSLERLIRQLVRRE